MKKKRAYHILHFGGLSAEAVHGRFYPPANTVVFKTVHLSDSACRLRKDLRRSRKYAWLKGIGVLESKGVITAPRQMPFLRRST